MVCVRRFEKFNHLCVLSVTLWLLSGLYREAADSDHVLGYRRPRSPKAGAIGQLQECIQGVHGEPVSVPCVALRAGRVVTRRPGTILSLSCPRWQPVLRDVSSSGADIEDNPVHVGRYWRLPVVDYDRE